MIPIRTRGGEAQRSSRQAVREAPSSRVVARPVPERQVKDTRTYQLDQLRRRFSPKETTLDNGDLSLQFSLTPSDPDFPYDLDHLECDLHVPEAYPKQPPTLHVRNKEIPRGFAINIEKGWDKLVEEKRGATLLALTNALDRRLESLLSEQKAETIKLTIFKDARPQDSESTPKRGKQPQEPAVNPPPLPSRPRYVPEEPFSKDQIAEAKARRAQEVRQLEARMSRLPAYQKSSDGIIYTLPLEPRRRDDLPVGLRSVQSVQLIIPLLYPLQSLRILLNDVSSEIAEPLEELFCQKAAEKKQMTLMAHLNFLAQNMHVLAKQAQNLPAPKLEAPIEQPAEADREAKGAEHSSTFQIGKGHVHVIPRPPEWLLEDRSDGSDFSDEGSSDDEGDSEDSGVPVVGQQEGAVLNMSTQTAELGTAMSFPSVELYNIELLQVAILNLAIKCDRCKTVNEITGLKGGLEKQSSCKKCGTPFTVRFRPELIHQNSTRAGFIDATACTVADLLPRSASSANTPRHLLTNPYSAPLSLHAVAVQPHLQG